MKKKIIFVLSIVTIIACMAMPVAASGITAPSSTMKTQYYGSTLCDKGVSNWKSTGRVNCTMTISKGGGPKRGEKNYSFKNDDWTKHTTETIWVDHYTYKCDRVHCSIKIIG